MNLDSRFRRLAQSLNNELSFHDQRLRFSKLSDRRGATGWRLQNSFVQPQEEAVFGFACEIATSADDGAVLQVAFNEQWTRQGKKLRFKSSNLRFRVISTDPGILPLQFRLEWVGRELGHNGTLAYPGKGAAHPHWQFDVNDEWQMSRFKGPAIVEVELDEPELTTQDIDLDEDVSTSIFPVSSTSYSVGPTAWFHKLHLPARALWSDVLRNIPEESDGHQHEPSTLEELDIWVVSALRYMRNEFTLYAF